MKTILQKDKIKYMKERNKPMVAFINLILTAIKNKEIATLVDQLQPTTTHKILVTIENQTKEQIESLEKVSRDDALSVAKEQFAYISSLVEISQSKVPSKKSESEVCDEINTLKESGLTAMKDFMAHFRANADLYDMALVSKLVKESI